MFLKYMKVSICITVKNEEKWIGILLDSLLTQSIKADEMVIVDGGSMDKTVEIIKHYQKKDNGIKLLIEKDGIAHGRNTAIDVAKYPIVAQIDAGCIAKENWLKKILEPFKHEMVGISAGFYLMPASSSLQRAMNLYLGIHPRRFDSDNFLPSARSVAFRKEVWEKAGGFDEKLKGGGEDTKFFVSCVKNKIRIARVGDAKVVWEETKYLTLMDFFWKGFNYAKGDVKTKIWKYPIPNIMSHNIKALIIFCRYILGASLFVYSFHSPPFFWLLAELFVLYIFWSIWKFRDIPDSWKVRGFIPVVQIVSDVAVMSGFASGLIE